MYVTRPKFIKQPDITFLLPSIKDYDSFGKKVVDSIYEKDTDKLFEVIVCHPDHIDDNRVVYVKDNNRIGTTDALNNSVKYAKGEVIYSLTDDHTLTRDPFGAYEFLQSDTFKDRKFKVTTFPGGPNSGVSYAHYRKHPDNSKLGTILNKLNCNIDTNKNSVMCFPIICKETLFKHLNRKIFNPNLKYLGDVWFGSFLKLNGEEGVQYDGCYLKSFGCQNEGTAVCDILNIKLKRFETEAMVNYYLLCKNYKAEAAYDYGKRLYISHEQI